MTDPTNVHEPVPQSAKLTAREKKWIIYDVGNSAFVLLSTAVIPIYAKSLMPADGNIVSAWGYAQTIASLVIALLMPATIIMATAMAHVLRSMSIAAAGRRAGLRLDGQTAQAQAGGNGGRKNAGSQTGHGYSFVELFRSTRCAASHGGRSRAIFTQFRYRKK